MSSKKKEVFHNFQQFSGRFVDNKKISPFLSVESAVFSGVENCPRFFDFIKFMISPFISNFAPEF